MPYQNYHYYYFQVIVACKSLRTFNSRILWAFKFTCCEFGIHVIEKTSELNHAEAMCNKVHRLTRTFFFIFQQRLLYFLFRCYARDHGADDVSYRVSEPYMKATNPTDLVIIMHHILNAFH